MSKRKSKKEKDVLYRNKEYYYGTSLNNNFWKKYKFENYSERGYGEFWLTRNKIYFRQYLTIEPIIIPIREITKIFSGHLHAGRITLKSILKIQWVKDDLILTSGFSLPNNILDMQRLQRKLQMVAKGKF